MKKRLWILCAFLLFMPLAALAGDDIPPAIQQQYIYGETLHDYLSFELPNGEQYGFVLHGSNGLDGYRLTEGEWQSVRSGSVIEGVSVHLSLVRHDPAMTRADGSTYADALGFDVLDVNTGTRCSYHYDGTDFTLCGWRDPARYDGEVLLHGTKLSYYASGSQTPEYVVDTESTQTLYNWIGYFPRIPATPEEGRAYAAILSSQVADRFPGYTLYDYYNSGGLYAEAGYAQVENGMLRLKRVSFTAGGTVTHESTTFAVPLSDTALERLKSEPLTNLISVFRGDNTFQSDQVLSPALLSPGDTLLQSDLQADALLLLVRDSAGEKRLRIVTPAQNGAYHTESTLPLPEDAYLDTFHSSEDEVQLEWSEQYVQAGYLRGADGVWRLDWVMTNRGIYDTYFFGVHLMNDDGSDALYIGSLPDTTLMYSRLDELPTAPEEILSVLDQSGWAVVHNPDPNDRLNLRAAPDRAAESLGKFYNGTPVRILEKKGAWYRVSIGVTGLEGYMMAEYLVTGSAMNNVRNAFPIRITREEYEYRPLYAERELKTETQPFQGMCWLIGTANNNELYIILHANGGISYAPCSWFWEGNG